MGIELQNDGTLTQNQFQLVAMDLKNPAGVTSFFEDFLSAAKPIMKGLTDPVNGTVAGAASDIESRLTGLAKTIADKQAQVDDLQIRLLDQMAAADALVSSMEQQYNYMASMFSAMQTSSRQYQ
jgi:flagellar capping protein FliD